jgi:hypothetical protein
MRPIFMKDSDLAGIMQFARQDWREELNDSGSGSKQGAARAKSKE